MERRVIASLAAAAALPGLFAFAPMAIAAQAPRPAAAPAGPAPRLPNGHPDLSGVLMGGGGIAERNLKPGDAIVLLPDAKKLMDSRQSKDDPEANCLPTGVPRMNPYPWRLVQTPTHKAESHIFVLFEGNIHSYRQIFMDGRPHPPDLDPTWYGHSIGRWEGSTLVVDTIGLNDKFWLDSAGTPHTEKLHMIERYTRPDYNTLQRVVTIDDPGTFTKPFDVTYTAKLGTPDSEIIEYFCIENNQWGDRTNPDQLAPSIPIAK